MKYITSVLLAVVLIGISGCSSPLNSDSTKDNSSDAISGSKASQTSPSAETQSATVTKKQNDQAAKKAVTQYMDALINKDYEKFRSIVYVKNLNITMDEFIKGIKENDIRYDINRSSYLISSINDFDDTHKVANIILKGKMNSGDIPTDNQMGLILVNNQWKVDLSMYVSKTELNPPANIPNIQITKIEKTTNLNGYQIDLSYKNLTQDKYLILGWMNKTIGVLTTNDEKVEVELSRSSVAPGKEGTVSMIFNTSQKSNAKNLVLKGLHWGNSENLPDNQSSFEINIPLN